ncbi:Partner of Y14 and mago [Lucilia cuprina]|uniref:Partner of Y14 and mago n=1 Tax=Lucilia cuprina TaxID=7375 RepID=A0A0L0BVG5_LUCCU|nr:Partner of Y14 and mago [Lucilia cuprina]KNC24032.1 Partner of Y14 and mago [Lucilia cuprina]
MATYSTNSEGKFIPATQRPDGTWRKARRVKEGYVPQEEVPLYESKGKQFAQRRATGLPPGLCPEVVEAAKREREKKERAKAKKEAAALAAKQQQIPGVLKLPANVNLTKPIMNGQKTKASPAAAASNKQTQNNTATTTKTLEALSQNLSDNLNIEEDSQELQKKCKKLNKKLREIEEIEKKLKSGALKKPEKDQLDKVGRKKEIEKELKKLLAILVETKGPEAIEGLTPTNSSC